MSEYIAIGIRFQIEENIKMGSPISLDYRYLIDLDLSNLDLSGANFEGFKREVICFYFMFITSKLSKSLIE